MIQTAFTVRVEASEGKRVENQILKVKKGELQVDEEGNGKLIRNIIRLVSEIVEVREKES